MTNTRSQWPAAQHLQEAATEIREAAADLPGLLPPLADWLDKTAVDMAYLVPIKRDNVAYLPWQIAARVAHGVLGLPNADSCLTCHTYPDEGQELFA
ncbi:hypothetical protein [Streptomyces tendae]|uniref:hypothetical protein n=1 Tax=Streptomyces tendae TaxID=1932 RepID=UPI0038114E7E